MEALTQPKEGGPDLRPAARQVARDAAAFAVGSGAAQAITILVAPILSRLYTPAAVGAAGVVIGTMLLFAPVACLRFDMAVPLARGSRDTRSLSALCLLVAVGMAALLGVVALVFGDTLCEAANVPQMSAYTWLVPLEILLVAPGLVGIALLTRSRRYNSLAGARLAQTVGQAGTQVSAGVAAVAAPAAWFAGGVAAGAAASSLAAVTLARRGAVHARAHIAEGFRGARAAAREWRRFAGWSSGAALMGAAGLAAPAILIAALYDPHQAGLFVLAQRVIGLPAVFAAEAVGAAWYGTAAEIVREQRGKLRQPLVAITRSMLIFGGGALTLVLFAGPPLFGPVFGDEWSSAGHLLFALAPLHFAVFAASPAGLTLQALGRTGLLTAVGAARLSAPVLGIAGGHALGFSLRASLGLYAAAMVAISVVLVTLAWRLSSRD